MLLLQKVLSILYIIFIIFILDPSHCSSSNDTEGSFNCSQLDRSRKLRAFILSGYGLDARYNSTKGILVKLGFDVHRYEPPSVEDPRWSTLYNKITEGITSKGLGTFESRRSHRKRAFLLSQAWVEMVESAFSFSIRHNNQLESKWLNDYTFFFEDDLAVHPAVQDPYCAIVSSIAINPPSGVMYLGLNNPSCKEEIVINGWTYGKGCTGLGLHSVGLRNSMAAPLIAAVRVIQGTSNTDLSFVKYSEMFAQSFWLLGANFAEETYRGIFYQDRDKFPTTKPISNDTTTTN